MHCVIKDLKRIDKNELKKILSYFNEFKEKDYEKIYHLLSISKLERSSLSILEKLILSAKTAVYSFEVKNFLSKNDKKIYNLYLNKFKDNSGFTEAFGIEKKQRTPYKKVLKDSFVPLEPVIKKKSKKKSAKTAEKKKIRRVARAEAEKKIKDIVAEKRSYAEKIKKIYEDIKKEN